MSTSINHLYEETNKGLDILKRVFDIPADVISNPKKKFKIRDERTASANLLPPRDNRPYWTVIDYGEYQRPISPIDAYMRYRNISEYDLPYAISMACEEFDVAPAQLTKSVNRATYMERDAREGEKEGEIVFEMRKEFSNSEVDLWGPNVKANHLEELGWSALEYYGMVKDGKVKEWHSNDNYPIFVQKCRYVENGMEKYFYKIYQPLNPEKSYRFMYKGEIPRKYLFGLDAVKRKYHSNNEQKLDAVVIVSGGSDAVNALSMGLQPVWLGSETAEFTFGHYHDLCSFAKEIYSIPDIDDTGARRGKQLALQFPDIKTIWLPMDDMNQFKDNRGGRLKDLKDYISLHSSDLHWQNLMQRARPAKFWTWEGKGKDGSDKKLFTSLSRICYNLWLNGYYGYIDKNSKASCFIHVENGVIEEVSVNDICHFLRRWMEKQGAGDTVIDKVMRSKDLRPDTLANNMEKFDKVFSSATADSQCFYFNNCVVRVTSEKIEQLRYSSLPASHFVWKDTIINHDYHERKPMFDISQAVDGNYAITVNSTESPVFCFFINSSRNHWRKELEERFEGNASAAAEYFLSHRFCINGEGLTDNEIAEQMQSLVNKIYAIGYLLHRYKMKSRAWAVVLYDYRISESDECNGRSGKSLYGMLPRLLQGVLKIDANKQSVTDSQFLYAEVTDRTDVVFIDECSRNLDYRQFFGRITDDFNVEKKNANPYTIPFAESPKMMFGTNYVIPNQDSSTTARLLPVIFSDYYHQKAKNNDYIENRSVHDDFNRDLHSDDYPFWEADIAFLMQCEQFYLSVAGSTEKILPPMENIEQRLAKQLLGPAFEGWVGEYFAEDSGNLDCELDEETVYSNYVNTVGHRHALSKDLFRKKLKEYVAFAPHLACFNPMDVTGGKKDGDRWRKTVNGNKVHRYWIRSKAALQAVTPVSVEEELPFDSSAFIPEPGMEDAPF